MIRNRASPLEWLAIDLGKDIFGTFSSPSNEAQLRHAPVGTSANKMGKVRVGRLQGSHRAIRTSLGLGHAQPPWALSSTSVSSPTL